MNGFILDMFKCSMKGHNEGEENEETFMSQLNSTFSEFSKLFEKKSINCPLSLE